MGEHFERAQERVARDRQGIPTVLLILCVVALPSVVRYGASTIVLLALIAGLLWWLSRREWNRQLREAKFADELADQADAARRARFEARWGARLDS
jgi:Flp pilus assembly protein TadB